MLVALVFRVCLGHYKKGVLGNFVSYLCSYQTEFQYPRKKHRLRSP